MKKKRFFALTAFCTGLFFCSCSQNVILETGMNDLSDPPKDYGVEFAIADVKTSGPSTLFDVSYAWGFGFDSSNQSMSNGNRYYGFSVRGVCQ